MCWGRGGGRPEPSWTGQALAKNLIDRQGSCNAHEEEFMNKRKVEKWPIDALKPNPMQASCFHDLGVEELEGLAVDLARHGQVTPIEVMEDGTILAGHQRWAAAKRLQWSQVRVWVRNDLSDSEATHRLLEENTARRQLDHLDQVRTALRLQAQGAKTTPEEHSPGDAADLRRNLTERLHITDRHLRRLIKIASTPMSVQRAFQEGKVSLVEAERVAFLEPARQKELARTIERGGDARALIRATISREIAARGPDPAKEYEMLLNSAERCLAKLADSGHELPGRLPPRLRKQLRRMAAYCRSMLENSDASTHKESPEVVGPAFTP
jgi:ParB/RepB/Spo0J family partition protein